jgi:RNA polymerase sigma factor (sigma-70 family)
MPERPTQFDTRITLLGRLHARPDDPGVWSEFVEVYGRKVYAWCRQWGLQESDAQDVTQEVFLTLSVKMKRFRYDERSSFRGWLKTITRRTWQVYAAKQKKAGRGSGDEAVALRLLWVQAHKDLKQRLAEAFDEELLKEATHLVQLRVEPRTWEAFRLLALEGRSGAEAAALLNMKVATVFVARSKVQRMLRDELARLE